MRVLRAAVVAVLTGVVAAGYLRGSASWREEKYIHQYEAWQAVEEAERNNLPKTALERLEPILQQALREKDYPTVFSALCRKIELEARIEGDEYSLPKWQEKIRRLQKEIPAAPKPIQPMLEVILAR